MLRRILACLSLLAILLLASSQPALAHERREVGKYTLVVGWSVEPALEGAPNSVSLRLTETVSAKGVEGLEGTVRVAISYGGATATFSPVLRAVRGTPGSYVADIIPTRAGDYIFRFQGKVETTDLDQRFESGPQRFAAIEAVDSLQFPEQVGSLSEVARDVRRSVEYAETTRTFFIGSLAISAMALIVAAAALVQARRRA